MGIGTWEIILIIIAIIILFGPKKIPEVARAIGKSIREFKEAAKEVSEPIINYEEDTEKNEKLREKEEKRKIADSIYSSANNEDNDDNVVEEPLLKKN